MTRVLHIEHRLLSRFRRVQIDAAAAASLAKVLLETDLAVKPVSPARAPGDIQAMRGVPLIGAGVGGAIPGTRPDLAVLRERAP